MGVNIRRNVIYFFLLKYRLFWSWKGGQLSPVYPPFRLGKKRIRLFFDTGASMFPILTGTNRLKKLAKHRKIEQVDSISSWGKMIPIFKPVETKYNMRNLTIENINLDNDLKVVGLAYSFNYYFWVKKKRNVIRE